MARIITVDKAPYNEGEFFYTKSRMTFEPGVTVLVGCNGIGKTTLMHAIAERLDRNDIPYFRYDNCVDGGSNASSSALFYHNNILAATLMTSSEGEQIVVNLGTLASKVGRFIRKNADAKELWVLLDAIDSGLSVDNVIDVKKYLFETILKDNENKDIYIIVSANAYEMCRNERCFDVRNGKYIDFDSYEEYREFVLESKKQKEVR